MLPTIMISARTTIGRNAREYMVMSGLTRVRPLLGYYSNIRILLMPEHCTNITSKNPFCGAHGFTNTEHHIQEQDIHVFFLPGIRGRFGLRFRLGVASRRAQFPTMNQKQGTPSRRQSGSPVVQSLRKADSGSMRTNTLHARIRVLDYRPAKPRQRRLETLKKMLERTTLPRNRQSF